MSSKFKVPHTFTIVFIIIIICAIATWIVPGGEFARKTVIVDGIERTVVDADKFQKVDRIPQTWQIFTAFFKGFVKTAHIIAFIFMIGGAFWILNQTNAINIGISAFLKSTYKLQEKKVLKKIGINNIIMILIIILFSLFGAIFGMSEETIAFIIIFVPLSISMGYDSVVGVLICYVAAHVGFAGAMFNPFTIGIAQGLSGLPAFSGLEYRFFCWLILTVIAIVFTLLYASKVKKNPKKSFMYEYDHYWRDKAINIEQAQEVQKSTLSTWVVYVFLSIILIVCAIKFPYTEISIGSKTSSMLILPVIATFFAVFSFFAVRKSVHSFILMLLLLTVIMLVIGVLGYEWYVMEIAGLFLAMGVLSGFAYNFKLDSIIRHFLEGCKDILTAAIVVGLAGGIIIILEDGKIVDTILYAISRSMSGSGSEGAVGAMYFIQTLLNIIIPSSSAKAALTIPMMAEFSDIIHVSRQLTVLAFQLGDGFTNMATPTSGVLLGVLGAAKIPYTQWLKFILPFIIVLIIIGFLLLLPPLYFPFKGF